MAAVTIRARTRELFDEEELFNVKVNTFDDTYHDEEIEFDDKLQAQSFVNLSLKKVRAIRRRYTDMYQFNCDLNIFETYMRGIIEKYGGPSKFTLKAQLGMVKDFIPAIPRLKTSKKLKSLEKLGRIFMSTIPFIEEAVPAIHEWSKVMMDNMRGGRDIPFEEIYNEDAVKIKKRKIDMIIPSIEGDYIKMLRKQQRMDNASFIQGYFTNLNNKSLTKKEIKKLKKEERLERIGISDYFNDNVIMKYEQDPDEVDFYKGHWLTNYDINLLKISERMGDDNWDEYKVYNQLVKNASLDFDKIDKIKKQKKKDKKKAKSKITESQKSVLREMKSDREMIKKVEKDKKKKNKKKNMDPYDYDSDQIIVKFGDMDEQYF